VRNINISHNSIPTRFIAEVKSKATINRNNHSKRIANCLTQEHSVVLRR